jgi:hypothetical protein
MANQTNFAFSKSAPAAAADEVLVQWLQSAGDPTLISGPVKNTGGVDARTTTSEAITLAARGKLVTFNNASAVAASLPNANTLNGVWWTCVRNLGAGAVTITPAGCTIDGASSLVLVSGAGILIFGDLTNYFTMRGTSSGGTVTSVALTAPGIFTVSGSPITGSGILALALANQSANLVWAGPTSGGAAAPTFRTLVANDLPTMLGDSGAGGTKGAVPAPSAGDAAAGKFLKANGSWAAPSSGSSGGNRGFWLNNISVGGDVCPHLRAGSSGTLAKVTVILRRLITATLTMTLYLDGVAACTVNVPSATAIDAIVAVTSFTASTVTADSIFKLAITASDSSVDPQGVATLQIFWS